MKVIVTGGAGFIGSHVVDRLLLSGNEVVVIDNFNDFYNPKEKKQNISKHEDNPRFHLVEGDIRDFKRLTEIFQEHSPEVVIHLAARAGVRPSIEQPLLYEEVNVKGTQNLLEATRINDTAQFIFASSSSVYGNNKKVPFSEEDPVDRPISPYAATKKAGELLCYTYHHLYNIPTTCLRFFTVYGPRQRPDLAIRKFMERILQDEEIKIYGDGTMERDFTYIDDIVEGIIRSLEKPLPYEIINLGNSEPISVLNLVKAIESSLNKNAKITHTEEQPGDVQRTYADTSKAHKLLSYHPNTPLNVGLREMVKWLKEKQY